MIIQFRNRTRELKEIQNILESNQKEFTIIYGRRRVGKTELILHATRSKDRIYYLAIGDDNLEHFIKTIATKYPDVQDLKKDWEVVFKFLEKKVKIIIIDEFQNLISEDKNILHTFQRILDITLKDSDSKLFILGSSISIMTSKVLSYQSPLYGRRTGSINLRPMNFFDLHHFFPKKSMEELVEIFGFADGIPQYLRIEGNFWTWLNAEIQKQRTYLTDEIDFLLRYEFKDPGIYKLILESIAKGNTKLGDIKNSIGLKRTDISPYLANLIEIGLLERKVPITESIKSRRGRYHFTDNFIKFWFRFIYPNQSLINEVVYKFDRKEYNQYLGFVFEKVCYQYLLKVPPIKLNKIGSWWYKEHEIDIVAQNDSEIIFIECKWKDNVDAVKILDELKEKTKFVEYGNRKPKFAIFAKSFKRKADCLLYDLEWIGKALS